MAVSVLIVEDDRNIAELLQMYLEKEGYEVKATDFLKIGVPFTLLAVLTGYLYCWFVWA